MSAALGWSKKIPNVGTTFAAWPWNVPVLYQDLCWSSLKGRSKEVRQAHSSNVRFPLALLQALSERTGRQDEEVCLLATVQACGAAPDACTSLMRYRITKMLRT